MNQTIKYTLRWDSYFWEEWHDKELDDSFDSVQELENDKDVIEFMNGALKSDRVMNLEIVKVITNYETVKVIKGRCECDM